MFSWATYGQLLILDNYNISGGNSISNGFGLDGVNTQITDTNRITGEAVTNNGLSYFSGAGRTNAAYSISNDALHVAVGGAVGQVQITADGSNAFDLGPYLVGKAYEFTITMDNDSVDTVGRRMSLSIGTAPGQTVNLVPLGVQLQADANSTSAQTPTMKNAAPR